ncbi:MAG: hypothetical protein OEZ65_01305 [Gemmatimonadota bacterium]|nr:hypothetical protein [Gemmatimonadota bacterium]MDH5758193.1 hypothetical protein [Gemmatimonadota bacterium]
MSITSWRVLFFVSLVLGSGSAAVRHGGRAGEARAWREVAAALESAEIEAASRMADRFSRRWPGARARYLQGTLRLAEGEWDAAATEFVAVLSAPVGPESRRRAYHNLALARLRQAVAADPASGPALARASVEAGREALRLRPGHLPTQWNLALAGALHRDRAPPSGDGAGVSLGSESRGVGGGREPLSRDEANRILDALRSGEGSTLSRSLERLMDPLPRLRREEGGPPW